MLPINSIKVFIFNNNNNNTHIYMRIHTRNTLYRILGNIGNKETTIN